MLRAFLANALLCAVAFACLPSARAEDKLPPGERLTISIITLGRGDGLVESYGHNAFVVESPDLPEIWVFNYGMFDFSPATFASFAQARLRFFAGMTEFRSTVTIYRAHHRDVRTLQLNLEPAQRLAVLTQLVHDIEPAHREYDYDHYYDNCSTRVRDVLDRVLGGQLRSAWSKPAHTSLRRETLLYTDDSPVIEWLGMFALGSHADRALSQWDDAFLPERLEAYVARTSYLDSTGARVPLMAAKHVWFDAGCGELHEPDAARWHTLLGLGIGLGLLALLLAALTLARRERVWPHVLQLLAASYGLCLGALGTLVCVLRMLERNPITTDNANLWLAQPLLLLAGAVTVAAPAPARAGTTTPFGTRARAWLAPAWTMVAVFTLAWFARHAFGSAQDTSLTASVLVPANFGFAFAMRALASKPTSPSS